MAYSESKIEGSYNIYFRRNLDVAWRQVRIHIDGSVFDTYPAQIELLMQLLLCDYVKCVKEVMKL